MECLRGPPPAQERMNRRDSDERRWDPGRASQVGRHLARRLHWRGETAASEERHRAVLRRSLTNGPIVTEARGDEQQRARNNAGKQTQAAPMASELVGSAVQRP